MTNENDKLNEFCANVLEPKKSLGSADRFTKTKYWIADNYEGWDDGSIFGIYKWQPLNFVSDPDAWSMLLSKFTCEIQTRVNDGVTVRIWINPKNPYDNERISGPIGYAVTLAFAKANGYKEGV